MSSLGKVFIGINLALAAVFVGSAASLIGTSQQWRAKFESEAEAHRSTTGTKDQTISGLQADLQQTRDESARRNARVNELDASSKALSGDLETERGNNSQMRASLDDIGSKLGELEQDNRTQLARITALEQENQRMRQERDQAAQEREEAVAAMTAAQEEARAATGQASDLRLELARASEEAESYKVKLNTVARQYGIDLTSVRPQPDLQGTVVAVSEGNPTIVQIGLGTNDKVQPGYTFDVYNSGGIYKGRIRVEVTNSTSSSCTIDLAAPGSRMEQGDRVVTRL